jgi:hypothetical protein
LRITIPLALSEATFQIVGDLSAAQAIPLEIHLLRSVAKRQAPYSGLPTAITDDGTDGSNLIPFSQSLVHGQRMATMALIPQAEPSGMTPIRIKTRGRVQDGRR